jgi:hypothetical protein
MGDGRVRAGAEPWHEGSDKLQSMSFQNFGLLYIKSRIYCFRLFIDKDFISFQGLINLVCFSYDLKRVVTI